MKIQTVSVSPELAGKLTAVQLGRIAQNVLHPLEEKTTVVEHEKARADTYRSALTSLGEAARQMVKHNPQEAKNAAVISGIAETGLNHSRESGYPEQIGACRGALEVISAFTVQGAPAILRQAAENLDTHENSLQLTNEDFDRALQRPPYLKTGLECLKQAAAGFNHQCALALLDLTCDPHAAFLGTYAAGGNRENHPVDQDFIAAFAGLCAANPRSQAPEERSYSQAALKTIETLAAGLPGDCARVTETIAREAQTPQEDPRLENCFPIMRQIGAQQGGLAVISTLKGDISTDNIARGARKVLNTLDFTDRMEIVGSSKQELRYYTSVGAVKALNLEAQAAGSQEAQFIISGFKPGTGSLKSLSELRGNNPFGKTAPKRENAQEESHEDQVR